MKKFKLAAFAGLLVPAAIALVALPATIEGASAAMKKKPHAAGAMKSTGKAKGPAAASAGKGKSGDPLNAAAGKKM